MDPWETGSITGLQITSQGMEDKKNSKAHFPAMRTEQAVEQKSSPIHLGAMIVPQRQKELGILALSSMSTVTATTHPGEDCAGKQANKGLVFACVLSKKCKLNFCH